MDEFHKTNQVILNYQIFITYFILKVLTCTKQEYTAKTK